ncbi:hypothetical protein AC578_10696 [Pseudocercospora eumusae]|uniref:Uncharacterized protein n=1 Tax=Pseudocercospora eumusae TaxID=321146 RepID=A0A139HJK6_9PEZI|nr:hypothetical protein AC578_10696 [Pseudocercospora eumusae]
MSLLLRPASASTRSSRGVQKKNEDSRRRRGIYFRQENQVFGCKAAYSLKSKDDRHMLQMLAFYLKQNLPYPVSALGSTSTAFDPISILKSNTSVLSRKGDESGLRTYPLFTKRVARFRFEYPVFLVNQDIRVLLENAFNLKVLDIRQTLPNLKYLLYVATAGEGDLPTRKAGCPRVDTGACHGDRR